MPRMADQDSKIQKVSMIQLCITNGAGTYNFNSEIHGPWDEAQPKLQRNKEKAMKFH
jgi:hypothetical protein